MKTFRLFTTMLVVVFCTGFTSCSNDDDDNINSKKLVSGTGVESFGEYSFTIEYDALGRVTKVKYIEENTYDEYIYSDDKITIRYVGVTDETYNSIYYLKDGLIVSDDSRSQYIYDADKRLIQHKDKYSTINYIWKDGNIVSAQYDYNHNRSYTRTYTYTEIPYHHTVGFEGFYPVLDMPLFAQGYYGVCVKNFVKEELELEEFNNNEKSIEYDYELDKDGHVTKFIINGEEADKGVFQFVWQ